MACGTRANSIAKQNSSLRIEPFCCAGEESELRALAAVSEIVKPVSGSSGCQRFYVLCRHYRVLRVAKCSESLITHPAASLKLRFSIAVLLICALQSRITKWRFRRKKSHLSCPFETPQFKEDHREWGKHRSIIPPRAGWRIQILWRALGRRG